MNSNPSESSIMLQLTAYLDGELGNSETQQVEERLATDQQYRSIMQQLQKTWDVLDILPASQANESFTQSTMKMVVDDAKYFTQKKSQRFWTWPLRILALILVPAAASAGAFLASHYVQDRPNQELQQDLDQIRDFDIYNKDKNVSIEFLELLATETSRLSVSDDGVVVADGLASGLIGVTESQEMENEERFRNFANPPLTLTDLESLGDRAKSQLRINRANFQRASPGEKQRVANLLADISAHEDSDNLKRVLYQYYYWLNKIPESDKAELLDLKQSKQRIAKIRSIAEEQIYNNFELQLPKQDFEIIKLMLLLSLIHISEPTRPY